MKYEFVSNPGRRGAASRQPRLSARRHDLRQRNQQDRQRMAGCAGCPSGLQATREGEFHQGDHGPPDPIGEAVPRSLRRHPGTARRGTASIGRQAAGASISRQVRLAGKAASAATRRSDRGVVADTQAVLRRSGTGADLDLLAASLPSGANRNSRRWAGQTLVSPLATRPASAFRSSSGTAIPPWSCGRFPLPLPRILIDKKRRVRRLIR